jgi:thiol:disulfide interchange protein DsbD
MYFSYAFFEKAFEIMNLENSVPVFIALIMMYYGLYSFFSIKEDSFHPTGMKAVLLFSILLLFTFVQNQFGVHDKKIQAPAGSEIVSVSGVHWRRDLDVSLLEGANHNKKIFIDFTADWCTNCKSFESDLQSDQEFQKVLNEDSIPVRIEDTDPIFEKLQNDSRFEELKIGLPLYAILNPDGSLLWKTNQFKNKDGMKLNLKSVQ